MAHEAPRRNTTSRLPRARLSEEQFTRLLDDLEEQILDRLDIKAAYVSMNVRFLGTETGGRALCYAVDRVSEKTPGSASVTLTGKYRGWYGDFAHDKLNLSLFQFAYKYGPHRDYMAGLRHFAQVAGVAWPFGEGRDEQPLRPKPTPKHPPARKPHDKRREDISADLLAYHLRAAASGELDDLAAELHVHRDGLDALAVGVSRPTDDQAYTLGTEQGCSLHPECRIIGFPKPTMVSADRRGHGKVKRCLKDRVRGIYVPQYWNRRMRATGYLFIAEGAGDIAALTSMGLGALGIPSAGGLVGELLALLDRAAKKRILAPDIRIICLNDFDVETGTGEKEMTKLSQRLADALGWPIHRRFVPVVRREQLAPPEGDERLKDYSEYSPAKDSRAWLGLRLANPEKESAEVRHALGRRFIEEVYFDQSDRGIRQWKNFITHPAAWVAVSSQVLEKSGVVVEQSVERAPLVFPYIQIPPTETGEGANDSASRLAARTDAESASERFATTTVAPEDTLEDLPLPPDPLASLPGVRPCLVNADREFILHRRDNKQKSRLLALRCRQWGCGGCRTYLMRRWAGHLAEVFRLTPEAILAEPSVCSKTPPRFYWRGSVSGCDRITNYVTRHKGQYVRISQPKGKALILANLPFPRAKRIDFNPTAAVVEALLAIVPPRIGEVERFVPITTSTAWRPPSPPKTGEWQADGCTNMKLLSREVWRAMGVQIEQDKHCHEPEQADCFCPPHWTETHRKWAAQWAKAGTVPPVMPGGFPPDPAPYFRAALDMPLELPPVPMPMPVEAETAAWRAAARLSSLKPGRT